ncbi:MAG: HEAT repeat domain-containing protein, partial [Crocosphaera sp.]
GNIGNEKAVEGLISALNHEDSDVRRGAAYALGNIGNEKAVEGLISALDDWDSEVRRGAAEALENIGSVTILEMLIQSPDINIYDSDIFPLLRTLAIKHRKSDSSFIPVYPELINCQHPE